MLISKTMKNIIGAAAIGLAMMGAAEEAEANLIEVTFDVPQADASWGTPIAGSFTYNADSLTDPITSIQSIDFTYKGHAFSLAELGFSNGATKIGIGGLAAGVGGVFNSTNDFYIFWNPTSINDTLVSFSGVAGGGGAAFRHDLTMNEFSVTDLSITSAPTPEPSSLVLAALGLLTLGMIGGRRPRR
jgi:MYXO-CTERM domain-containing protein